MAFQNEPGIIRWKTHFRASPAKVYRALSDPQERARYWADSVEEKEGKLFYDFHSMGFKDEGCILKRKPSELFAVEYLKTQVFFRLTSDGQDGTDLELTVREVPEAMRVELIAGWVNFLLTMKGAIDFGIDLRNHDPKRTWEQGYVEN